MGWLRRHVASLARVSPESMVPNARVDAYALDSLATVELLAAIRSRFGREISMESLSSMETLEQLGEAIRVQPRVPVRDGSRARDNDRGRRARRSRDEPRGCILAGFVPLQASPPLPQAKLLEYTAWLFSVARCTLQDVEDKASVHEVHDEVLQEFRRYAVSPDYIGQRSLLLLPPELAALDRHAFMQSLPRFHEQMARDPRGDTIDVRMRRVCEEVMRIAERAWPVGVLPPDDIVHVTCSVYAAPNPIERVVSRRGWRDTVVTNAYHMGCYAAFPAVRIAQGLLASPLVLGGPPKTRVDILHTEVLSSHLDLTRQSPGDIVTMTLFGDGFIRYCAYEPEQFADSDHTHGLRVLSMKETLLPESQDEMTWELQPHAFEMSLSPEVGVYLHAHVEAFAEALLGQAGVQLPEVRDSLVCALHPGGPKIVELVRRRLQLSEAQVSGSLRVLAEHGNMSSATVPYIWKAIVEDERIEAGQLVLSMAFGPGLTATGMVLEKVVRPT